MSVVDAADFQVRLSAFRIVLTRESLMNGLQLRFAHPQIKKLSKKVHPQDAPSVKSRRARKMCVRLRMARAIGLGGDFWLNSSRRSIQVRRRGATLRRYPYLASDIGEGHLALFIR